MKLIKFGIHLWIALTSVGSFLAGWIMLAHAPKPIQPKSVTEPAVAPLPTLTPLTNPVFGGSQDQGNLFQNSPTFIQPPVVNAPVYNAPMPSFRTGGS